jgi:hypothetical protein
VLPDFPIGKSGFGLLMVRNALVIALLSSALYYQPAPVPGVLAIPGIVLVACLCVGLLTTWVAALCGTGMLVAILATPQIYTDQILIAGTLWISVVLLGAYSIDSLWHGRRKRIFP